MNAAGSLRVRDAHLDDAEELTRIAHASKASWGYPDEWLARWRDELTITRAYLSSHLALVAEDDAGRTLGFAALAEDAGEAELDHLWVDPTAMRRGIGSTLLRALVTRTSTAIDTIMIRADPHAVDFYRRAGARLIGSSPAPMPDAPARTLPLLALDRPQRQEPA